jgi:molybdopterin converting factor subunit 1
LILRLLYFAAIREIVGTSEQRVDVPANVTTIGALRAELERTVPALAGRLGSVRWAKNEDFVAMDATLADGDVIALIPPVAGG